MVAATMQLTAPTSHNALFQLVTGVARNVDNITRIKEPEATFIVLSTTADGKSPAPAPPTPDQIRQLRVAVAPLREAGITEEMHHGDALRSTASHLLAAVT